MRFLIGAIFALASHAALAGVYLDADGRQWNVIAPPEYWFSRPGKAPDIKFLPRENTFEVCKLVTGKADMFGCARLWSDGCDVTVVADLPEKLRAAVVRHETAHCHGWPADHPID